MKRTSTIWTLFLSSLLLAPESMSQKRPFTVDDVISQESARSWELSPDGTRVLWLKSKPDTEKDRMASTLMLTTLDDSKHRELTVGRFAVSGPKWSPDGQRIAFLSSRKFPDGVDGLGEEEKGSQIWVLDLRGGMVRPVTKVPHGIGSFDWQDDDTFVLTARERRTKDELDEKKRKDKTRVVEDMTRFRQTRRKLFTFDLGKKKLQRVADTTDDSIQRFSMAPGGKHLFAWHETDPSQTAQGDRPPRFVFHDLETGTATEYFESVISKPNSVTWASPTRAWITLPYSTVDGEDSAAITVLARCEVEGSKASIQGVDLDWRNGLTGSIVAQGDTFLAPLANGLKPKWRRYEIKGDDLEHDDPWMTEGPPLHSLVGRPGVETFLGIYGDASTPDAVHQVKLRGGRMEGGAFTSSNFEIVKGEELYRPNGGFEEFELARSEELTWKGANDDEIEGLLYYPNDYQKGRQYPLVLITHGGPHAADQNRFSERWANSPNLYTKRGAFVLKTNYHGSSDYGLEFGESIKGRYYELELIDMIRGIQKLIAEGKVDEDRLGLVGWSNGAILSIAMLTHADDYVPGHGLKFRACAPGAGDVNWTSDYGNCAFGASFDRFYVGGSPWDQEQAYIDKSPLFRMENVTTPTIVFFGSEDRAVPTEQGWQHFRAMQTIGKAPVRFLLFPGEGHGLSKLSHQRRKLVEELAWLDQYLFDAVTTEELEKPTPLSVAEAGTAPVSDRYSTVLLGGEGEEVVLPLAEITVKDGETKKRIRVGTHEVSRRQWARFRQASGDLDLPVTGVRADEAQAFCRWLSEQTGRRFRLPTLEEHRALPKGSSENTLAYWAGYTPNPDEAAKLAARVEALGADRALMPCGSRMPGADTKGLDRVFFYDVGGNAAEWVQTEDGLRTAGGCAARVADPAAGEKGLIDAPLSLTGFRIVEEIE